MKKIFYFAIVFSFVLSSCQSNLDSPIIVEPAAVTAEIIETATFTATIVPATATDEPPTATTIPTATSTATMTPTPVIQFDTSRIYGIDNRGDYISVILEFPGIDETYDVSINNNQYNCKRVDGIADRLYCSGPVLRLETYAKIKYFHEGGTWDIPLYEGDIYVPKQYATPMPAGDPRTWCPLRGTDVFCETEHRVENGEECWVMSCFDACGYYYSYHTCQEGPHDNFLTP